MTDKWDRQTGFCCDTCAYYAPKDGGLGRCRRHAPTLEGYPVVYAVHDWCGDHKIGSNPSKKAYEDGRRIADTAEQATTQGEPIQYDGRGGKWNP